MSIPKGYKLVPVVATLEMKNAGWRECERQGIEPEDIEMQTIWTAMHLESPPSPQPIYDEAKERGLFEAWYLDEYYKNDKLVGMEWLSTGPSGNYRFTSPCLTWKAWLACAQSRAKAVEVGHE